MGLSTFLRQDMYDLHHSNTFSSDVYATKQGLKIFYLQLALAFMLCVFKKIHSLCYVGKFSTG